MPSSRGPAVAWDQAAAHGPLPIEVWATWPSGLTLDQLVESRDALSAWLADVDKSLSYVRDTQRNAESYKATMEGHLGALLKQVKNRQAEIQAQRPADAIGNFKKAMSEKAAAEKSAELATIAGDKQSMTAVLAIFDQTKSDAAPITTEYASITSAFTAYRATEAAETAAYAALAQRASGAGLDTLPDVEQAILATAQSASAAPDDLSVKAMQLSARIQVFEVSFRKALAPYEGFLATHGVAMPDPTSRALRSLDAMLGYIQQRIARGDAAATSLVNGTAMRRQALTLLQSADPDARTDHANTKLIEARNAFTAEANARVQELAVAPPASPRLKLPYLARRYDALTRLLQMEPLCDPSSSSWREAGCVVLRDTFGAAATSRTATLPAQITSDLATMRAKGMDAALLDAAQAKLDQGDVKGAAIVHDAAVDSAEGL